MASKSTAAGNSGSFCVAVQRCAFAKCNKNGTHHLSISANSSSETGQDCLETMDVWYCEKHYKKLIENKM
jgi:hypothetical protein